MTENNNNKRLHSGEDPDFLVDYDSGTYFQGPYAGLTPEEANEAWRHATPKQRKILKRKPSKEELDIYSSLKSMGKSLKESATELDRYGRPLALAASLTPVPLVSNMGSAYLMGSDIAHGDYGSAAMNGAGMLVPYAGGYLGAASKIARSGYRPALEGLSHMASFNNKAQHIDRAMRNTKNLYASRAAVQQGSRYIQNAVTKFIGTPAEEVAVNFLKQLPEEATNSSNLLEELAIAQDLYELVGIENPFKKY